LPTIASAAAFPTWAFEGRQSSSSSFFLASFFFLSGISGPVPARFTTDGRRTPPDFGDLIEAGRRRFLVFSIIGNVREGKVNVTTPQISKCRGTLAAGGWVGESERGATLASHGKQHVRPHLAPSSEARDLRSGPHTHHTELALRGAAARAAMYSPPNAAKGYPPREPREYSPPRGKGRPPKGLLASATRVYHSGAWAMIFECLGGAILLLLFIGGGLYYCCKKNQQTTDNGSVEVVVAEEPNRGRAFGTWTKGKKWDSAAKAYV